MLCWWSLIYNLMATGQKTNMTGLFDQLDESVKE
jgi:hypothetical protein